MKTSVSVTERRGRRGVSIVLDYRAESGRRIRKTIGRASSQEALQVLRQEAERQAKRIELEMIEGRHRPRQGDEAVDALLVEFFEHVQASNRRKNTIGSYHTALKLFRRFLQQRFPNRVIRVKDITPALMVDLIGWFKERGNRPDSIATWLKLLSKMFNRAVAQGTMASNPLKHEDVKAVKPKKQNRQRVFTDNELQRFLRAVEGLELPEYRDFYFVLSQTGLRLREAAMLRWMDIDFQGNCLKVTPHSGWEPKTPTSIRSIPLTPEVRRLLLKRLENTVLDGMNRSRRVFNVALQSTERVFRKARLRAGLDTPDDRDEKLCIHTFRHYFLSKLANTPGVPLTTCMKIAGHSSVLVTQRYTHCPEVELHRSMQAAFGSVESVTESVTRDSRLQPLTAVSSGFSGE